MFFYIEAYSKDGEEILGNLDGQGILLVKSYKRTNHYKRLVSLPKKRANELIKEKTTICENMDMYLTAVDKLPESRDIHTEEDFLELTDPNI